MMRPFLLATVLAAIALPAVALEPPGDYAGDWTMSGLSEGAAVCDVILTADEAIGGWSVQLAADCQDRFVLPEDIAAWTVRPGGAIAFIDPLRQVLLTFEPTAIGGYVARPAEGEPIALDRAGQDEAVPSEQERMSGTWTLTARGGTPTCTVRMAAAADGMTGRMRKLEGCRAPWSRADLSDWTRKDGRIILLDSKGRPVASLNGDSHEGFTGAVKGAFVGFVRQWDAP